MAHATFAHREKSLVGLIVKILDRIGKNKGSRDKE
jgi:hypothetical protein